MLSKHQNSAAILALMAVGTAPAFAQADLKSTLLKHMKTSREFTLKVADQMPEATYDFKLTPPQMSFAEQMVHLSQAHDIFLAPIFGEKTNPGRPASNNKKDVIEFMRKSFDRSVDRLSKITPEQLSKTYTGEDGTMTGLEMVMFLFDHTTHHRASAEMYLRAKGITPAEYQF
jgi:uncharacterized damage-inducible protein DinB